MRPRRWSWVAVLVGVVLISSGVVTRDREADVAVGTVPAVTTVPAMPAPAPTKAAVPAGPPVRLRIPTQRVDAPVAAVDVAVDGSLQVPADPAVVGWWRGGAPPGGPAGSVVLDGHVDTYDRGPGALFRLAQLRPGDLVQLVTDSRTVAYAVAAVRAYAKADLPADVFDRTGAARLVLISCGGPFDRTHRSYRDNVVVYGIPTS